MGDSLINSLPLVFRNLQRVILLVLPIGLLIPTIINHSLITNEIASTLWKVLRLRRTSWHHHILVLPIILWDLIDLSILLSVLQLLSFLTLLGTPRFLGINILLKKSRITLFQLLRSQTYSNYSNILNLPLVSYSLDPPFFSKEVHFCFSLVSVILGMIFSICSDSSFF